MRKDKGIDPNRIILLLFQKNVEKVSDLMGILGLKETRTKKVMSVLVVEGKLIDDGVPKGKWYKKLKK